MTLQCGRAIALGAPSVGTCRVVPGGGRLPLSLHPPHHAVGGWWVGWPPGGGGLPMSRLSAGVHPSPRVHWLASRARSGVCCGVHGTQTPLGWPWCPLLQQCLTPRCVSAHVRQGKFPCRSQTEDLVSRLRVSFVLAPFRVAGGVKMGAAGLPLPTPSTVPPAGAKTSFLWSAGAFSSLA